MSVMSSLDMDRYGEPDIGAGGADLSEDGQNDFDDFASDADISDGYDSLVSDHARFDFSKPADVSMKTEASSQIEDSKRLYAERSDVRMGQLREQTRGAFSAPYISTMRAAEYGLMPGRVRADDVVFAGGLSAPHTDFTSVDTIMAHAQEIGMDTGIEESADDYNLGF